MITGKGRWVGKNKNDLIVAAITHLNAGGNKEDAPVAPDWHDYLVQLSDYVRTFKENYEHRVSSAVLASGKWLLIFTEPAVAFYEEIVNESQFLLLEMPEYVSQAHRIFELISRVKLADTAPFIIRSSQLPNYVSPENLSAVFHGLLICYEKSGEPEIRQVPQMLFYPALIVERADRTLFTVIDAVEPIQLHPTGAEEDVDALKHHMNIVNDAAQTLIQSCSTALGCEITPKPLDEFRGFPETSQVASTGLALGVPRKLLVRPTRKRPDAWIAVTGEHTHYFLAAPRLACQFHSWSNCRTAGAAIGVSAIGAPILEMPRAFFMDTSLCHCANLVVEDRREKRCYIRPIDGRTCCKVCVYQDICWSPAESADLPCGN